MYWLCFNDFLFLYKKKKNNIIVTHSNKTSAIFHNKLSYWFYQKVKTFSDNLTPLPKSSVYLSYIWRYDILWSKPFTILTEGQREKMMVKYYILHWYQCRKILRIMHHLMHKTIINQHQNKKLVHQWPAIHLICLVV